MASRWQGMILFTDEATIYSDEVDLPVTDR